jgi:MSHA biogenesis protein MshL
MRQNEMTRYNSFIKVRETSPGNKQVASIFLLLLFLGLAFTLCGCAGPQTVVEEPPPVTKLETETPPPLVELQEIVLPQREQEKSKRQKRYSLQVREADVQEVLLAFSEQADINLIIDPAVTGKVTVDLKNVTLGQVLDAILVPLGIEYQNSEDFIKIYTPKMETRIFQLDYITTVRKGRGLVAGAIGGRDTGGNARQGDNARQSSSGGFNEVLTGGDTDLWKEIEEGLKSLKSAEGSIIVNKISNSILVKDYSPYINRIAEFLEAIEGSVQRQVMIQVTIMEISLSDTFEAGINWGFIQSLPQMSNLAWGLSDKEGEIGYPGSTGSDSGSGGGDGGGETIEIPGEFDVRPFSGVFRIGQPGQTIFLSDIMEALSTQGDVKILSNPRIATLNNQPAIIKVATEDVFFETTRTLFEQERTTESSARYITIGIVLGVTPQIGSDGTLTMSIHPSITEKIDEKVSSIGDTAPVIAVRETDTVVRVSDEQTILIAGLMQDKVFETIIALPLMRDIPLIGKYLFEKKKRETRKTELVIMLTPKILTGESIEALSSAEMERFKAMENSFSEE